MKKNYLLLLFALISVTVYAHKSGPITYQHYGRAFRNDVCEVLTCDKDVTGRIEVPYNVSRDFGNWVVESIADGAFQECQLSEVQLSGAIRTIGGRAFYNCPNLKVVELKRGVKFIETGAFSYCTKLETINFPTSLKYIGDNAFYNCISLKEIVIEGDVESLGQQAFFGCKALEKVTLNAPITKLEIAAFSDCSSLKTITLPRVHTICSFAFERAGLQSIAIGPYIKKIEYSAFSFCSQLVDVYVFATTPPSAQSAFPYGATKRMRLYVPPTAVEAYRAHPDWKDFGEIIPYSL